MRYLGLFFVLLAALVARAQDGAAVYKSHCASCHDAPTERVPSADALRAMSLPQVLGALQNGPMKTIGDSLTAGQRSSVALYLATPAAAASPAAAAVPPAAFCSIGAAATQKSPASPRWIGWSTDLANSRFQPAAAAGLSAADVPKLKLKWAFGLGNDYDFGQPPILVSLTDGRQELVIAQKSAIAYGLDAANKGAILWQKPLGKGGALGGSEWGSASDGRNMYVALSDLVIKGAVPDKSSMQGYRLLLDPNQGGGLFALRLDNGELVWNAKPIAACGDRQGCSPSQSQAVSVIPGVVFSGSLDGHLRAYSTLTGEVLWDVDTARDYTTLNGQPAHGGSLDGPGPVIAGGMVYVNSGYGQFGGMPGNVLLAFSVDGN
jgi:outer membrane protein assembly factor BamB